ncbi:MAG: restriction endonuclease subunit S, partial [Pyrinomonadaceae bacterium]|nr:restriction endonuclease subunit S [Pyrinomonadaceae bacterium]
MQGQGKPPKDDKWKAKYAEPAVPDTNRLPALPEGWTWAILGQLAHKITDGTHSTPKYVNSGVPFISVNNISDQGLIDFSKTKFITLEEHKELYKRCDPSAGDVLLTKVGTVGLTAVVPEMSEFSLFVNTALIKPIHPLLSSHYIAYILRSNFITKKYADLVGGSTQQFVGIAKIGTFTIQL